MLYFFSFRNIPDGDVLLVTGDFTSRKYSNQTEQVIEFNNWLGKLPHKYKIVIAGNNDVVFDSNYDKENNGSAYVMKTMLTNAIYLQDSSIEVYGLKIYGSPWVPYFRKDWAFALQRGKVMYFHLQDLIPQKFRLEKIFAFSR